MLFPSRLFIFDTVKKIGLILEGGGNRGVYTAGVLDYFMEHNIVFPYCVGVSAGAAYGKGYVANQPGRSIRINETYTKDSRYMSWRKFFLTGNLFDWDFVFDEIPNNLMPFDYDTFYASPTEFWIGITNCDTGELEFVDGKKCNRKELMLTLAASASVPIVFKKRELNGSLYLDGGIVDSFPVDKAFADGCEGVVVISTRHPNFRRKEMPMHWFFRWVYRKHPKVAQAILDRVKNYNAGMDRLRELEKEGKVFFIRPQEEQDIKRFESDVNVLRDLYDLAKVNTADVMDDLRKFAGIDQ